MNVREHLLALHDELRRLKGEGNRQVVVTEEGLAQLRKTVDSARAEVAALAGQSAAALSGGSAGESERATQTAQESASVISLGKSSAKAAPSAAPVAPTPLPERPSVVLPEGTKKTRWEAVREMVLKDAMCRARVFPGKHVVFGVGNLHAEIMFIGEAPGADEEDQGEPFVGRAGQLLSRMIKAMGLEREQVYIGNILNWRPEMGTRNPDGSQTGNRPPTQEEMAYCLPFIRAQIDIVAPKVLVALGKTAVDGLLGPDRFKTMGAARGAWHDYQGRPLRATYHPSYLLRQEGLRSEAAMKIKRDAWEDLLAVMERADLPISDKQRGFFKRD
jgi:uracil-DNA glycosylase